MKNKLSTEQDNLLHDGYRDDAPEHPVTGPYTPNNNRLFEATNSRGGSNAN